MEYKMETDIPFDALPPRYNAAMEAAAERVSLREAMGGDAYEAFLAIDPDAIPDEELFE